MMKLEDLVKAFKDYVALTDDRIEALESQLNKQSEAIASEVEDKPFTIKIGNKAYQPTHRVIKDLRSGTPKTYDLEALAAEKNTEVLNKLIAEFPHKFPKL